MKLKIFLGQLFGKCAICLGAKVYESGQVLCNRHAREHPLVQFILKNHNFADGQSLKQYK